MMTVHVWLAATNVVAIHPIWIALLHQNTIMATVIFCAAVSSVLMHMSETKHGLDPGSLLWREWSWTLLNLDRAFAYLTGALGICLWMQCEYPLSVTCIAVLGFVCAAVGEWTRSIPLYVTLHTVWHVCAYMALGIMLLLIR
jgi:hypothetical protein